jgi:hypothetical protein
MKQLLSGFLVLFAGIAAIVFNRFCAEEGLKWRFSWLWQPSLGEARVVVIVTGLVAVFLGLAILAH